MNNGFNNYSYEMAKRRRPMTIMSIVAIAIAVLVPAIIYVNSVRNARQQPETPEEKTIELTVVHTFGGVSLTLPEGFFVRGDKENTYAKCKGFSDFVHMSESGASTLESLSEDNVRSSLENEYGDSLAEEFEYKQFKVGEYDAVKYKSGYREKYDSVAFTVCSVLMPEKTVTFTFVEYSDHFSDAFARCAETIRIGE